MSKLKEFYIECMSCKNTTEQCPSTWKNYEDGIPPRGFHFESEKIKILVIGKNPGHPLNIEKPLLKGFYGSVLFEKYMAFHHNNYKNFNKSKDRSNTFHKNLFRYLSLFLNVDVSQIYKHSAHTNLVKCSTESESAKLNKKTIIECYNKFLKKEIKIYNPKVIIALGNEVYNFLNKNKSDFNIPLIKIKHPSYYYSKEKEDSILQEIKDEILKHLV